jgi:multidrug efflux system membrane fusion protein
MNKLSIGIALLATALLSWNCTEARTETLAPLTPVKIQAVEAHQLNNGIRYSATIRPTTQMELAFKNGGFVESIVSVSGRTIDQGDWIAQGTVLARLRLADFEHRVEQTSSQLREARSALDSARARADDAHARLEKARQDFVRSEQLFNAQSVTRSSYDAAKAEYDSARAKAEAAMADIDSAQSKIAAAEATAADAGLAVHDAALIAPMSGTIIERSIERGSLIGGGRKAFVLADTHSVKAVFGVPDTEIQNVRLGMSLEITSEAMPERTFSGRVTSIAPAADEKSRIFETEVTVANLHGLLKSGMIVSVAVGKIAALETVAAVPLSAIVRAGDATNGYAVYVVDAGSGQSIARRREVSLGEPVGNMIVVKDGLNIGETVVSLGATLVRDGGAIQIVP